MTAPRRRRLRDALAAVTTLLVLAGICAALLFAVTPSVSDAPVRVAALSARDGATHTRGGVPARFVESLVASEDARFYAELGIDPVGIARAAWLTVAKPGVDPGGSTLSQQLAKRLYTHGRSGLIDVVEQMALAVKLNLDYSKAQILRMYAASVYFGSGFYGLHDASCGYFAVPPRRLTLAQASLLAGVVQAPTAYDPLRHLALARARQHYVLTRLVATGRISPGRARTTAAAGLHLRRSGSPGTAACAKRVQTGR